MLMTSTLVLLIMTSILHTDMMHNLGTCLDSTELGHGSIGTNESDDLMNTKEITHEYHMSTTLPHMLGLQLRVQDSFDTLIPHGLLQRTDLIQFVTS